MPLWVLILGGVSLVLMALLLFLVLFEPGLEYKVERPGVPLDSDEFLCLLGALSDAEVHDHNRLEVLANGDVFYEAELAAIRAAKESVHVERYIFAKGEVASRYIDALAERARAGVKVKLVLDAMGSFTTWDSYLKPLREAGGRVCWYQPIRWTNAKRFNNRTHRELVVIDGRVGFVGGAGVADWWYKATGKKGEKPQWRDTMFRVEGEMLIGLQTCFAENWLESSGEILGGDADYFPACRGRVGVDRPKEEKEEKEDAPHAREEEGARSATPTRRTPTGRTPTGRTASPAWWSSVPLRPAGRRGPVSSSKPFWPAPTRRSTSPRRTSSPTTARCAK